MSTGINRFQKTQIPLAGKILILVEGEDELNFLIKAMPLIPALSHLNDRIAIVSIGGRTIELLTRSLAEQEKRSGFHQRAGLAIWMDAEDNAASTHQTIRTALNTAQLPVPELSGTFIHAKP